MHDSSYRPVIQPRVNIAEDVRGYWLQIDGTRVFIPHELLPETICALSMILPPDDGFFKMLGKIAGHQLAQSATVVSAEDG